MDTQTLITYIKPEKSSFIVAANPNTNHVFVAHSLHNKVTVIDGATNTVIATLTVDTDSGDGIVVDTATDRVYVTNSGSNTVSVIQDGYAPDIVALTASTSGN